MLVWSAGKGKGNGIVSSRSGRSQATFVDTPGGAHCRYQTQGVVRVLQQGREGLFEGDDERREYELKQKVTLIT